MSIENDIQDKLKATFRDKILGVKTPRERRMFVQIPLAQVKEVILYLKQNFNMTHLTTITAIDVGENIEVIYHFFCQGVALNLSSLVPKSNPVLDTVTTIIPGAVLYEREIQDMLGLKVKDIPDSRRLVLPESWPEGVYPLRKDFVVKEN
jgi:membrane-bound hydrogenase subunit beta